MRRSSWQWGLILLALIPCTLVHADVVYQVDMEGFVDHLAISHGEPNPADMWWANQFDTQSGGETITQVGISFGGNLTVGGPMTIGVYSDPNNDGSPNDAVLLHSEVISITFSDGAFHPPAFFPITPTSVSGKFFIAAALIGVPGNAGAVFEADDSIVPAMTASVSQQRSWIAIDVESPGTFNMANVLAETSGGSDLPPTLIDDLGAPGNWVLRAVGTAAVPEPAAWAFMTLIAAVAGCGGAMMRRWGGTANVNSGSRPT
jgi:hypothetical protein